MAENPVKAVLDKFTALNEEYKAIEAESESDLKEYNDYCNSSDEDLSKKLGEIREKIAKIDAYMEFAKAHASDVEAAEMPFETEIEVLEELKAKIDVNSANDYHAETLYTKASGQRLVYEAEMERTDKKISGSKVQAKRLYDSQLAELHSRKEKHAEEFRAYIASEEFKGYLKLLSKDAAAFNSAGKAELPENPEISLGQSRVRLPVPTEFDEELSMSTGGVFNSAAKTIGVPFSLDFSAGKIIYIDYEQRNESFMLGGVQRFLINVLKYYENSVKGIFFADPTRFNSEGLGHIAGLSKGANSIIEPVAANADELLEKLKEFKAKLAEEEEFGTLEHVLVFHSFPESYSDEMRAEVLELVSNTEKYKTTVILTHNAAAQLDAPAAAAENTVRQKAESIRTRNGGFYSDVTMSSLFWYSAPSDIPEEVRRTFIELRRRAVSQQAAAAETVAPVAEPVQSAETPAAQPEEAPAEVPAITYKKEGRGNIDFRYGSDPAGRSMSFDFAMNGSTAFVCGTKRAGRTGFARSIIDKVISTVHPDNVELWLIDFDGIEFKLYEENVPPHVRYLMLGGGAELAYNVIDRLSEVAAKRALAFKGRWEKYTDVPEDVYMPEIICIIEDYSVMAAALRAKPEYGEKLRRVLEQAETYGIRVIFAADSYSEEGETPSWFAGGLIRFNVAMNSTDSTIATLFDGVQLSAEEILSISNIPLHHAFARMPVAENGSSLKFVRIATPEPDEQIKSLCQRACISLSVCETFEPNNPAVYISKQTVVKSIAAQTEFDSVVDDIAKELSEKPENEQWLYIGSVGTLCGDHPLSMSRAFGQNVAFDAADSRHVVAANVVISAACSALMQGVPVDILSSELSAVLADVKDSDKLSDTEITTDLAAICKKITALKADIVAGKQSDKLVVILDADTLFAEMKTLGDEVLSDGRRNAAADLIFCVSQGAKLGCHFFVQSSADECTADMALCKSALRHKLSIDGNIIKYRFGEHSEAITPFLNLKISEGVCAEGYLL